MIVKARRLYPDARFPTRAHATDAGWDLFSMSDVIIRPGEVCQVDTGIALEIEPGHYGQVFGKSGLGLRGVDVLSGVIDPGYRGSVAVILANAGSYAVEFWAGDRIAQLVILALPDVRMVEADALSPSDRGTSGFGSSGR